MIDDDELGDEILDAVTRFPLPPDAPTPIIGWDAADGPIPLDADVRDPADLTRLHPDHPMRGLAGMRFHRQRLREWSRRRFGKPITATFRRAEDHGEEWSVTVDVPGHGTFRGEVMDTPQWGLLVMACMTTERLHSVVEILTEQDFVRS